MDEWLIEKELLDRAEAILGFRVKMPTLRRYKSLGLMQLQARRVGEPKRGQPARTVAQYHWQSAENDLRLIAKGLAEGKSLREIAEARVRSLVESVGALEEMNSDLFSRFLLLSQIASPPKTEEFIEIERGVDVKEENRRLDLYIRFMPEPDQMRLLQAAARRYEDEEGQRPQEFYNREQALHLLGGGDDEAARKNLQDWFTTKVSEIGYKVDDPSHWYATMKGIAASLKQAMSEIRTGNSRGAYSYLYWLDKYIVTKEHHEVAGHLAKQYGMTTEEYEQALRNAVRKPASQ